MKLVECVPNFSEGKDKKIIDAIASEIEKVDESFLLDVYSGKSTNRTVMTFVGTPEAVIEAAYNAIKMAMTLIDMSKHWGVHPRIGVCDVCPFIPVLDITMDECVQLANRLGERIGKELGIPIYLYEYAASTVKRKNLAKIRSGEYEKLADKLKDPEWRPDYGPVNFDARTGAAVIGARKFLIAYNVNLNTTDPRQANQIAAYIRESGGLERDELGNIVRSKEGSVVRIPGRFKAVKAVGWYIEEYGFAQVSTNLIDYKVSPLHQVYEICCQRAQSMGLQVIGSELVGLVPLEAILMAGRYYRRDNMPDLVSEPDLVAIAVDRLGLERLSPFRPKERIIEYAIAEKVGIRIENIDQDK